MQTNWSGLGCGLLVCVLAAGGLSGCDSAAEASESGADKGPATAAKTKDAGAAAVAPSKAGDGADKAVAASATGEPLRVDNASMLELTAKVVVKHGKPTLHLQYNGEDLAAHGEVVENQLRDIQEFNVTVPDFEYEGSRFVVHVMTVKEGGDLELWTRNESGCVSPGLHAKEDTAEDVAFVVLAAREDGKMVLGDHYPIVRIPPMLTGKSGG